MIAAVVADIHLTERKGDSYATLEEQVQILDWIGRDAAERGAEVMLCAGDVFDSASTPAERNAAIEVFADWAQRMPVVVVYGNHDRPGDLDFLGHLRTKHGIRVHSRPFTDVVLGASGTGIDLAVLPWPRKAILAARLEPGQDVGQVAAAALRVILQGFAATWDTLGKKTAEGPLPRIVLAHAELGTALSDAGQPMVGRCDVELAAGDLLDTGADVVCLGHIHKFQTIDERIVYAGGIRQTTFGEDAVKGYILVDVARGRAPVVTHRQGPGRELVTVNLNWDPEAEDLVPDAGEDADALSRPADCAIRLSYVVSEDCRQQAADAVEAKRQGLLAAGAHSVKLDARIIATHRVRSEAARGAKTTAEKLEALWTSRGQRPAAADRLLSKLATLETEVQP